CASTKCRCETSCVFLNDTASTEIYTLSLHDALPICLDVPLGLVQQVDGAEDAAVPYHRQVQHRGTTERGDQLMVEEDLAEVGRGAAEVGPALLQHLARPEGRVERLAARDGIGGRPVRPHAL